VDNDGNCAKWSTNILISPYGRCKDANSYYAKQSLTSYYLEGAGCQYHEPITSTTNNTRQWRMKECQ
jgi:hypothetical protein